ncbi:MAG: alpha-galactosidase [Clostridiales bacterium]|jgi:alpha-galactosidase|nr:alpha-galactosidase [Clostridiales bacterium]
MKSITDRIEIWHGNGFITVKDKIENIVYSLGGPSFEIGNEAVKLENAANARLVRERALPNGGNETEMDMRFDNAPGLALHVVTQSFPGSPFVRMRYELHSEKTVALTKSEGRDSIEYFTLQVPKSKVTEIQLSSFNPLVHSYNPWRDLKSQGDLALGCEFPGPIALLEREGLSFFAAYEHGAEAPDSYLLFGANEKDSQTSLALRARKGNYYNGEEIGPGKPFRSPWFHFAASPGTEDLLRHYRTFMLKYICEQGESRKPYIYYNTWNNQERNRCIKGIGYWDDMNLPRMLAEIEKAHALGVDVFVLDTGWFEKSGDWNVDTKRFPDNLKEVKGKLDEYEMRLGLWLNPLACALSSKTGQKLEYRLERNEKFVSNEIWGTEESWCMCIATGYADILIEKMIELRETLGATYFKWDGISQYGCNSPNHGHGDLSNSPQEREECYSYRMGLELTRVVQEVTQKYPEVIVDFDITEGGRYVGLGFLQAGKYFLINNGPYASDYDLPKMDIPTNMLAVNLDPYTNMFFFPGAARSRLCRQGAKYDGLVPSTLFLTHFLPDKPAISQRNALASLVLGGNGIWGDLVSLDDVDVKAFAENLAHYKLSADSATQSYPISRGYIGSSPEIYEKLNEEDGLGFVAFFAKAKGVYTHVTRKLNNGACGKIIGADAAEEAEGGRIKLTVKLEADDARIVYFVPVKEE